MIRLLIQPPQASTHRLNSSFSTGPNRSRFTLAMAVRHGDDAAAPPIAAADRTGDRIRQNSDSSVDDARAALIVTRCSVVIRAVSVSSVFVHNNRNATLRVGPQNNARFVCVCFFLCGYRARCTLRNHNIVVLETPAHVLLLLLLLFLYVCVVCLRINSFHLSSVLFGMCCVQMLFVTAFDVTSDGTNVFCCPNCVFVIAKTRKIQCGFEVRSVVCDCAECAENSTGGVLRGRFDRRRLCTTRSAITRVKSSRGCHGVRPTRTFTL